MFSFQIKAFSCITSSTVSINLCYKLTSLQQYSHITRFFLIPYQLENIQCRESLSYHNVDYKQLIYSGTWEQLSHQHNASRLWKTTNDRCFISKTLTLLLWYRLCNCDDFELACATWFTVDVSYRTRTIRKRTIDERN